MSQLSHETSLGVALLMALLQLSACGDSIDSCEESHTCASSGTTGDGDTTDTGSGGTSDGSGGDLGDGDGDGDTTTDTETGGGTTGDGDGDQCLPAICPDGYCVGADCLECVHGDDNKGCKDSARPACLEDNTCAQCAESDDCTDPEASVCNDQNECVACTDDDGCSHFDDTKHCLAETNTCVQCTIELETDKCGAKSCDPATHACTDTTRNTVETCESCVADSECIANHHCVPMEYKGAERGGYCLETTEGGCSEPYATTLSGRVTMSGTNGLSFCGIKEQLTTCEAVLALVAGKKCPQGDSECPEGGVCRKVGNLSDNRCTYECTGVVQCLENTAPPQDDPDPGSTCNYGPASGGSPATGVGGSGGGTSSGGSNGTGGQKYCGG